MNLKTYFTALGTLLCLTLVIWAISSTFVSLSTWRLIYRVVSLHEEQHATDVEFSTMLEKQRDALIEENMMLQGRMTEIEVLLGARRYKLNETKKFGIGGSEKLTSGSQTSR